MKANTYGAPMGAPSYGAPKAPICLRHDPVNAGGYAASDGSYWGRELPL